MLLIAPAILTGVILVGGFISYKNHKIGPGFTYNLIMAALAVGILTFASIFAVQAFGQILGFDPKDGDDSAEASFQQHNFTHVEHTADYAKYQQENSEEFTDDSVDNWEEEDAVFESSAEAQSDMEEENFDPNTQEAETSGDQVSEGEGGILGIPGKIFALLFSTFLIISRMISGLLSIRKGTGIFKELAAKYPNAGLLDRRKFVELGPDGWNQFIENHGADQLRRFYQQLRNLSQQAIYVICCMTLLYAFVEDSFDVVFITVLNFGLFFILDDWQIMHQYSEKAQGNLLRKHRLKTWAVNIVLVLSCVGFLITDIDFKGFDQNDAINLVIVVLVILFTLWRIRADFNVYHEKLQWKSS